MNEPETKMMDAITKGMALAMMLMLFGIMLIISWQQYQLAWMRTNQQTFTNQLESIKSSLLTEDAITPGAKKNFELLNERLGEIEKLLLRQN